MQAMPSCGNSSEAAATVTAADVAAAANAATAAAVDVLAYHILNCLLNDGLFIRNDSILCCPRALNGLMKELQDSRPAQVLIHSGASPVTNCYNTKHYRVTNAERVSTQQLH
jgi:hypothetical protein